MVLYVLFKSAAGAHQECRPCYSRQLAVLFKTAARAIQDSCPCYSRLPLKHIKMAVFCER